MSALQSLIDRYGVLLDIEDLREDFLHRAGVCQFDGEQTQTAWAECLALIERAKQTSQGAKP